MALQRRRVPLQVAGEVTTLELFFDLVFVFAITQLTSTLSHGTLAGVGRAALLLLMIWWMYSGYAWLTNAAPPVTPRRRALLLVGMIGNFVAALAIPHAYGVDRVVFAGALLLVVLVHAGMYVTEAARVTRGMILQLLGWNIAGAGVALAGAIVGHGLVYWWLGAVVVQAVIPRTVSITSFNRAEDDGMPSFALVPPHFIERHGLMLLIALGESVLAIGVGVSAGVHHIGLDRIAFAGVSLMLASALYWAYFGTGEEAKAEAALDAAAPERTQAMALASFGYAFWVVLFAVMLTASGLHHALAHPTHAMPWAYAAQLCCGVGAFWAGLAFFRRVLGIPGSLLRLVGGLVLAAVTLVAGAVSAFAALVLLLAGSVGLLVLEH